MSNRNLEKTLMKELEILNDTIDEKIIKGLSYGKEARRHKFIVSSLAQIRYSQKRTTSWFGRFALKPFSFVSSFIL